MFCTNSVMYQVTFMFGENLSEIERLLRLFKSFGILFSLRNRSYCINHLGLPSCFLEVSV